MPPAAGEIDEALEVCIQTLDEYEQMQARVGKIEPSLDDGAGQGACDFTIQDGIDLCRHIAEELRQYSPRMAAKWEWIASCLSDFDFVLRSLEKTSSQEEAGQA